MLLRSTARLLAVVATVAGAGGMGLAAPASACACGGIAPPIGQTASVDDEVALLGLEGTRETIVMRLSLQSSGDNAALIVPTPAPATVTEGSAATFDELDEITAPREIVDYRWFPPSPALGRGGDGAVAPGGAANSTGAPTVVNQVRLGPLEATTLSGGDSSGVREWLNANGYALRDEVIATLQPYLSEGWSFVAMRLTGSEALRGRLNPVRLTFDTDHLVYPMRMSSAATGTQSVRLYVLNGQRVTRSDPDATSRSARTEQWQDVDFAGRISDPADADLRRLSANGNNYLTELTTTIRTPAAITSDFTFTASSAGDFQHVVRRTEVREILSIPAGYILVVSALGLIPVLAATIVLRRPTTRVG
ncbi:DUF2330 domain-containing protein [Nocardia huaxiensis]|uniref:DUF2330 domain-containing protein n=1 Tax=Nocardia huaxiensis TaxID=2755382 RepID=A0A7D6Z302_9NOCA|nr:DUF2330 domain-containing protein [Nocardia huaxiensis]QLY31566.1 DUF2330 domain-containing protein [Nocardia huaxiensis]UFS95117.1 DUF2330 domain-containing protein [Nocardia huaxiensis]